MNNRKKKHNYGKCHACGEQMQEKRINQDFWLKGKLIVIESVPTGVCPQCGEKIVRAEVGRQLLILVSTLRRNPKRKTIAVPVIKYAKIGRQRIAGAYVTPSGATFHVVFKPGGGLYVVRLGAPDQKLVPYKGLRFRIPEFADVIIEFVEEQGQIAAMKQTDPSGEYVSKRKQ